MSISKHIIYVIKCNRCDKILSQNEDDGYMTWFYSRKEAIVEAMAEGWAIQNMSFSKFEAYCPDCTKKIGIRPEYLLKHSTKG